MHTVLDKCDHIPNLEGGLCDLLCANPDDQDRKAIHHREHDRKNRNDHPVDKEANISQVTVGTVKPILLKFLFVEGANNHHTRKVFSGDQVETIN